MIKRYKNSKITTKINSLIGIAIVIIALLTSLGKDFLERPGLYVGSYANNAKIFIIAVSFVFMVIMIASGYYIRKCIKKPLDEIVKAIKIIGDGGVEIRLCRSDERYGDGRRPHPRRVQHRHGHRLSRCGCNLR